ncbi:copper chaperone PCu(A)C [Chthonobacter albigriseus]|uniref:copper chaperone PCu(A)C n=1 Tax=Chthonobacter albigriseus TaxID=1683161 RepID=UPI0015EFDBE4|nr:copper chaperone PCu(A)C [Chthonobacter albigriseus]
MTNKLSRLLRPSGIEETIGLLALALAVFLAIAAAASAHSVKVGTLELKHPWARATPEGAKVAGGFTTIVNTGTEPDRLVSGTATFAGRVEIHEMAMEGDVMRMRPLPEGIEIPAGGEVALKPGSFHLMFLDLKAGLKEGERVKGTLTFEKAGTVDVEFAVEAVAAGAGKKDDHGGHGAAPAEHGKDGHDHAG